MRGVPLAGEAVGVGELVPIYVAVKSLVAEFDTCKQRVEDGRREIEDGHIRIVNKSHTPPNQETYHRADLDAPSDRR